jgi:carboxyl-terminal processing protease
MNSRIRRFSVILLVAFLLQSFSPTLVFAQEVEDTEITLTVPSGEEDLLNLLLQVKKYVESSYPAEVDAKVLYQGMIRGMLESLGDPYTEYYTEEEFSNLLMALDNAYSGVGVVIEPIGDQARVSSVVKDSPAEKAGLMPGDIILAVDENECTSALDVATQLRGDPGTSVVVTVNRPSTGELLIFTLSREYITPSSLEVRDLEEGMYYIKISQFTSRTATEFPEEFLKIKENGAKGLVLDLRDNPGGMLDAGNEVAARFIPQGPIVELVGKGINQVITNRLDTQPIPVVVLVNSRTASASEIVAGAVRDYDVGRIVGEKTYGKGVVQRVLGLSEGLGGIKVTIAEYYTPNGTKINGEGLEPDFQVEDKLTSVPEDIKFERTFKYGSFGSDVLALQESLTFLGYSVGRCDGIFGNLTDTAIRSFCEDNGIPYNGLVDQDVIFRINSKVDSMSDVVLQRGIEVLKYRLQKGSWE